MAGKTVLAEDVHEDRIDRTLVARGIFPSRAAARAAIEAGGVFADGDLVSKPSQLVRADVVIQAEPAHPYVSRGGLKLAHALDIFRIDSVGRRCLDLGASTGGFTDVLLKCGAAHIVAVDVGRGQLHPSIAGDPRVTSHEGRDARTLTSELLGAPPDLVVCDLSFIGLEKALEPALELSAAAADLVVLFKPQFQVGPAHVGKGGIVTDRVAADRAASAFEDWLAARDWRLSGWTDSPIRGGDGNVERLAHARRVSV